MQPAARARQEPVLWAFLQSSWAGHLVLSEAKCPSLCSKDNAAFSCNPLGGCVGKGGGKVFERTLYSLSRFFPIRAFSPFHSLCSADSASVTVETLSLIMLPTASNIVQINLKKCAMWELQVKCYLGQDESYSPGDSTSDNSEKMLQRSRGKISIWVWQRKNTCNQVCIKLFSVGVEVSSCSSTWFNPFRGRWQVPICSWHKVTAKRT